jgi:hypothetical protein
MWREARYAEIPSGSISEPVRSLVEHVLNRAMKGWCLPECFKPARQTFDGGQPSPAFRRVSNYTRRPNAVSTAYCFLDKKSSLKCLANASAADWKLPFLTL